VGKSFWCPLLLCDRLQQQQQHPLRAMLSYVVVFLLQSV